ncbi:hypothetical protein EVAR_42670_1 [Eumeta japonica]|uniref:Uncharacterized protein n=1 Tax=Eumeta variegata TaxID=151549 RepID=A0A4C1WYD3_EUMVA|nr:hypothetical protein EVAR_42670_1 [Eumeta japonica]
MPSNRICRARYAESEFGRRPDISTAVAGPAPTRRFRHGNNGERAPNYMEYTHRNKSIASKYRNRADTTLVGPAGPGAPALALDGSRSSRPRRRRGKERAN